MHPDHWAPPAKAPTAAQGAERRALGKIGTGFAVASVWFWSMLNAALEQPAEGDVEILAAVVGFSAAALVATSMLWRRRYPLLVCLGAAALGVVLPIGSLGALIAFSWVVRRHPVRPILVAGGATLLATAASLRRDGGRTGSQVIWSATSSDGTYSSMTWIGYVILALVAIAVATGVGLLRRYAANAAEARGLAAAEATRADTLTTEAAFMRTELSRQEERDLIAREMHDTVAHHLSVLSLHASALEVGSDDDAVGEAARSMRTSARTALDEMHGLIHSLRAGAEHYAGTPAALADLPRLLDDARSAGLDVSGTVFVQEAEQAPDALNRAVYRVVQESLTNVVKHAPGARADVDVRARPGQGVDVVVRNALPADGTSATMPGAGAGLVGMQERCEALSGTFSAGAQDGRFVVTAHLPWAVDPA
ncbi:Signal transduction histidine kinase [Paraoerskovia marina]|uniref:histidine kinase n=1 Tax=Paraoerskovia marina TaxID=545619 RepID=A0A1H1P0P9_9CELL|nr:histidine kinase [Paraoerskovia marina]SDS04610.1 Signal transduction histidine kinase [Paraoerskovia marina]